MNQRATTFPGLTTRAGALMVEGAVVLGVLLVIVFAVLDLGLAVLRQNTLSEAARKVAREAIVRGEMAPPRRTAWGPSQFNAMGDDSSEMAALLRSALVAMDPAEVAMQIEWLDGGNASDQRVRVTVTYAHALILPLINGGQPLDLTASSTMRIVY